MLGTFLNSRLQRAEKEAVRQEVDLESGNKRKKNDSVISKIIICFDFSTVTHLLCSKLYITPYPSPQHLSAD